MKWRIRESEYGGYVAEKGVELGSGVPAPSGIGFLMPAFAVYESARFETKKQAMQFVKRQERRTGILTKAGR